MAPKSDRWIAEACRVGHPLVAAMRKDLSGGSSSTSRQGKDGKSYPTKTKTVSVEDELADDLPDEAYPDELVETDSPCRHVAGVPTRFHTSVAGLGRRDSKSSFMDRLEAFSRDRTLCASEGA